MDDLSGAISGFLQRPDAMEQLQAAAKQLGLGAEPGENGGNGLSPELLKNVAQVMGSGQEDEAACFLQALRTMLRPERREKVDRAIRAVQVMNAVRAVSALTGD